MSDIWGTLKGLLTQIDFRKVYIDNPLFRLHYKVTAIVLIVFGILVTSRQYIGDPIDCITDEVARPLVDQYCWVHGTYTKGQFNPENKIHYVPGVKAFTPDPITHERFNLGEKNLQDVEKRYHTYYQWVWCALFLQAFFFYVPHWIWKTWEGGRLKTLVADLNTHVLSEDRKSEHKAAILDYFSSTEDGNLLHHNAYAFKYIFCEVLNFVNILTQVFLLDSFLNYEFSSYGTEILRVTQSRPYYRNDYMTKVFPIVTLCQIPIFGVGGNLVFHDALCVLPINILNEKIYIFIWFWFFFLTIASGLGLVYRVATVLPFPQIKTFMLQRLNRSVDSRTLGIICQRMSYGDWFILYRLGRNMNPIYFGELIKALVKRREGTDTPMWNMKPSHPDEYDKLNTMEAP